jgi:hypothetical protein
MSARLPAMPTDRELATAIDHLSRWEIDSRQIVVRVSDDPSATPVEVWTATLQKPVSGGSLPLDVMAELKVALESTEGYPPPYLLDTRRGYTEWGASGVSEVIELVVGWGLAGIVGNATYDALLATVMRLARTFRHDSSGQPHPVDQQEAEERGRHAIHSAFDLSFEDVDRLVPTGAERRGQGWFVRYELDERRYEVELLEDDGLVTVVRVGWSRHG